MLFTTAARMTEPEPLHPETLTWTMLLARWTEFARASLALPADRDGTAWRESVPAVITLQAVTCALGDLGLLPAPDRPLARDKAEILVRDAIAAVEAAWAGAAMPDEAAEIAGDALSALRWSAYVGTVELVWEGGDDEDEPLVMPAITLASADGTLALAQPGTIVMPGEPVAWWVDRDGADVRGALPGCDGVARAIPRQVYRQFDEDGRIRGDIVAPLTMSAPDGLPLLVPLYEGGRAVGRFTLEADAWETRQRAAMTSDAVPVVFAEDPEGAT
jgi:hypothetical protein